MSARLLSAFWSLILSSSGYEYQEFRKTATIPPKECSKSIVCRDECSNGLPEIWCIWLWVLMFFGRNKHKMFQLQRTCTSWAVHEIGSHIRSSLKTWINALQFSIHKCHKSCVTWLEYIYLVFSPLRNEVTKRDGAPYPEHAAVHTQRIITHCFHLLSRLVKQKQ